MVDTDGIEHAGDAVGTIHDEARGGGSATRRRLTWVATGGSAVETRVDEPASGEAVGALVVVPSFGREAVVSYRTVKALAVHAARAGFVGLSFSFTGDGDSHGLSADDEPATRWVQDVNAVVELARSLVGPDRPVHLVGLRLGSSVLAALPESGPGLRIHWEPVSGRAFLMNHTMLRQQAAADVPAVADGVELDGVLLSSGQAKSIATLRAPRRPRDLGTAPDGTRDIVRVEQDRAAAARLALGAPYYATVPLAAIAQIVAGLPRGETGTIRPWAPALVADLTAEKGRQVRESLCAIGPDALPAIVSECPGVPARAVVVFTAMGSEIKAGPGNLWATEARRLAADGIVGIRADRGFLGDAIDPDATEEPRPYTDRSVADVTAAVEFARVRYPGVPVVAVGLCAGAWSLLRASAQTPIDRILAINLVHWSPDAAVYTEAFYRHYHRESSAAATPGSDAAENAATASTRRMPSIRRAAVQLNEIAHREAAIRLPWLRSLLRPDVPLDRVRDLFNEVPATSAVTVAFAPEDYRIFVGKDGLRAARRSGRRGVAIQVVDNPLIDHSLFAESARRQVSCLIDGELAGALGEVARS